MPDRLEAYAAFSRMMELRSFSAVGRQMRISQSTVSKHIAGLEAEFGVQLFTRTTRRISPTPEASAILEHVQRMLESLESARAAVRGQTPEASGLLRLAAPVSLGRSRILPLAAGFLRGHPRVSLEVILTDEIHDLVAEGFELAIIASRPQESSLVGRAVRTFAWQVVASPAYLAAAPAPEAPIDLDHHTLLLPSRLADAPLEFDSEHGRQAVRAHGRLRSNSDEAVFDAALAGDGVAIAPSWLTAKALATGALVALMPDYYLPPISVRLVYPQTRFLSLRARSFIDYIVPELARETAAGRGA
ncbi:LysR family transcriptional regulator [Caulobacter sp. SSI4214]|uniref:LysR family transcriptional regulator n=1 Tax=Caulobacter sp. SSI4214 TaxID=2575739 RepID=UPI00143C003B|nr:LysR family transcriptional regulator [Caulobacter sp. SSI4214]